MVDIFEFFLLIHTIQTLAANQPVTVSTKYGDVRGYQTDIARIFYGIPFAEPPVDKLR